MRRVITGIIAGTILLSPINAVAYERQCVEPVEVTYEEAQLLMKIASCEAGNQGIEGQRYVMSVVINRVNSPDYPDSIKDVIYQPYQFATKGLSRANITTESHLALADIERGSVYPGIIAFENIDNDELEQYFSKDFVHKDHAFYIKKTK